MSAEPYPSSGLLEPAPAPVLGRRPLLTRAWARRPHVAAPARPPGRAPRQLHQGVAITCRVAAAHLPVPLAGAHIVVNGRELLRGRWGRIELPLPAGHHHLRVYLPRGRRQVAECLVDVPAHHLVELEYGLSRRLIGAATLRVCSGVWAAPS
ncbi:hypothetical protein V1Y59_23505 [Gordonia sp. PKS22-38]|uniref:PEGA domain-containing protein n=1 Tax=Gordonia prachuapensis TaxID=3115651 RepID=A0ABU7N0I5_9ACTN|nr:hypothetical protein [Gordonia sp. PKS22-38]